MSDADKKHKEPLNDLAVRKLLMKLGDAVTFSKHALERKNERALTTVDIINILSSPTARVVKIEQDNKTDHWKYNLETNSMGVCLRFVADFTKIYVITAYRKGK